MIKKNSLKVLTATLTMALIFTGCSPKAEEQNAKVKEQKEVAKD